MTTITTSPSALRGAPTDPTARGMQLREVRARRVGLPDARPRVSTAVWIGILIVLVLFVAASLQIRLISGQRRLDVIEGKIETARIRRDELRRREADLRSPAQIAQTATDQLHMVHAAPPLLVTPTIRSIGSPTAAAPPIDATAGTSPPAGAPPSSPSVTTP